MMIKLHDAQKQIYNDTHRFRVVCAGRRFGKSVLAQLIAIKWAIENPHGVIWIVSPTYRQGKQIHWRGLQQILSITDWVVKKNEVDLSITLKNGSVIELKGAENPDALRGVKLRGLVVDEIASIRNWDWLWSEVLRATLTDYQAPVLFISTPKGYNHFYELYQLGSTSEEYKSWRFTSYDNPHIKKEEINNAKKELTEDTFAQEYLADFRKFTGLVYKGFQREIHVIKPFDVPENWQIYRAIDFGSTNPTAVLWIGIDGDDNWFILGEHYETGQTIDYHAGRINAHPLSRRVSATYGDPSGKQWILELSEKGVYISKANKETGQDQQGWVRYGIEKVAEQLKSVPGHFVESISKSDAPKLFIVNTCTETIREFETYRWKEKSVTQAQDLNEPDVPEKANDHCLVGDTLIDTIEGQVMIRDLVGKTGYLFSESGKIRKFYDVKKVGKEQIYEIEFMDGKVINCSREHPFKLLDGDWCPAYLLHPLDLIQSVTYGITGVQWKNILSIFKRKIFQQGKQKITQSCLGILQWPNTQRLAYSPQGWESSQQLNREFRIKTQAFSSIGSHDTREERKTKTVDKQDTTPSFQMAWLKRRLSPSFRNWQVVMAKEKEDKKKLLTLRQRIRYLCWDAIKVLPPQLQNESQTAQIKRITRKPYKRTTYNLEVEDTHSYSIAGGIIVSNSMDALRYFAVSYKKIETNIPVQNFDNWRLT